MKFSPPLILLLVTAGLASCKENDRSKSIELNLKSTTNQVELFGEGLISTDLYEREMAISPDGKELTYTLGDYKQQRRCLVQFKKVDGKWIGPEIMSFSGDYHDIEPFYADEGRRLYFASDRPIQKEAEGADYNIWYSDRDGDTWSEPKALNDKINTEKDEFYPSLSRNGNLYFTSTRGGGMGREDIFVSERIDGEYQDPVALDSSINTSSYEFNSYINPEENLLIFSSFGRADGFGGGDLYYSKRGKDGKWSAAINMGDKINSPRLDYCPFVDEESNTLFFTSERMEEKSGRINSAEGLREFSNRTQNGMGNIYRISMEELGLD
jgi:hypothetical protein